MEARGNARWTRTPLSGTDANGSVAASASCSRMISDKTSMNQKPSIRIRCRFIGLRLNLNHCKSFQALLCVESNSISILPWNCEV